MLFDLSTFRRPLPEGVRVFASGANREPEILAFDRLGIPVGVSVNHLNQAAIAALIELRHPVMIDSGAFSEVAFTAQGPKVLASITDQEWRRRLSIYLQLALALRDKAMLVAPDRVGDQEETLNRLRAYRTELVAISATGASLLLPLQIGTMSHAEFFAAAQLAAGVPLTPAMPMRKAATSAEDLLSFVGEFKPRHIHLLGIGIENSRAKGLVEAIRYFSPGTTISMDSNRLRAVAGHDRPLTRLETELRSSATKRLFGAVDSQVLALNGEAVDYTDLIASPSQWAAAEQLSAIANAAGMTEHERSGFATDPDQFLQSTIRGTDSPTWMEHPFGEPGTRSCVGAVRRAPNSIRNPQRGNRWRLCGRPHQRTDALLTKRNQAPRTL